MVWDDRSRQVAANALALGLLLASGSSTAQAQGFRVDRYPSPAAPGDLLFLERAATPARDRWPFVRATISFADDPLVVVTQGSDRELFQIVDEQLGFHLSAGARLFQRIDLALLLPIYVQSSEPAMIGGADPIPELGSAALGDPAMDVRVILLDGRAPLELALAATIRTPFGSEDDLAGDIGVSVTPRVLLSRRVWPHGSWLGLSLGVALRREASMGDLEVGSELVWSVGGLLSFAPRIGATVELSGSTVVANAFDEPATPIEGIAGVRYDDPAGVVLAAGVGGGMTSGYGSPDVRMVATAGYQSPPPAPSPPSRRPPPRPSSADRDGDTIRDEWDQCPDDAEDRDDYADDDGCPDGDNDGDGIPDVSDRCAGEPEEMDHFQDDDGCPDPDNDGDGLVDSADVCVNEPEDIDQHEDDDGCPDPDDDGDGILDRDDHCPNEAETRNGVEDRDGCPDWVRVGGDRIRTLEPVYFRSDSDRILERSFPMLRELAELIRARPDLGRVSVEGHTDSRGSDRRNETLSGRRAASVLSFLVEAGVPRERLQSRGYGESRPIESNATEEGRQRNRRVDLILVDRAQPP